jgi:alpha-L-arabinofuranosidase
MHNQLKRKNILLSVLCVLFFWCLVSFKNHQFTDQPSVFKVTANELFKEPISPLLYGNFIELGYGLQTEPMICEMFFNRSFEKFAKYRDVNKLWFDVAYDENDLSKGYEKDWSKFDWYHSGYQHNAWFAVPGEANNPSIITDSSTFFNLNSIDKKINLVLENGGSGHGTQYVKIVNNEANSWGGIAQEGKLFKKGESYHFTGMVRSDNGSLNAEMRIYPQGKWDKPLTIIKLTNLTKDFTLQDITWQNKNYSGYVTFSLWIAPQSTISVDDFSLKPIHNYYGWRNDVVEVFKQLNPGIIRFPGGCFASFYDWKNGIGPYSERKPTDSYFWGGQNYNDVGTAEFAMLCKATGAQMQMCVNVYHPSKRKFDVDFPGWQDPHGYNFPNFMSLSTGAKSAADWVAYCNLPVGASPMADLRARHGYTQPFGAKYWELDNEAHRWFEAEDYAWAVVVYSKAMKAVDPTIKIGMSSYGERTGGSDYHKEIDKMLEIAGPYIDFLADRGDAGEITKYMIAKVDAYNARHHTHIKYCDTEWLAYNTETNRDSYNMAKSVNGVTKSYMFGKWTYGMNLLKNFMSFQRMGNDMLFVNFNNLANTHSQSAMETPKEGAYLTASGRALELLSHSPAAWLLQIKDYEAKMKDEYQVQAAWNKERNKLVLYVCNRTNEAKTTSFDLSDLSNKFPRASVKQLVATSPVAMNTLSNENAIQVKRSNQKSAITNNIYTMSSPAYSFTEIVLEP